MSTPTIPECYIDSIGKARFSGGVVRLDLVSATEGLDRNERTATTIVTQRLMLSPEGFVRTVSTLNTLLKQLVDAGVIGQGREPRNTAGIEASPDPQPAVGTQTRNDT